jgi:hypothetical protein
MMRATVLGLAVVFAAAFAACGGDSNDPRPTPTPVPGSSGPLSDEEYLAVICGGLSDYTAALLTASSVDEIRDVVQAYIDSLEAVEPPADVVPFHTQFVDYLVAALEEPTALVTTPRPLPEKAVRDRLADLEPSVEVCDDVTYFAEREEDTPG